MHKASFVYNFLIDFIGEIIFDKNSPLSPPDIVFGPDDEEFTISLDELKVL